MKRERSKSGYDFAVPVHDHFDGSAHCVECDGECRLTDCPLAYTALVRFLFQSAAMDGRTVAYGAVAQLKRIGVNTDRLMDRAIQAANRIRRLTG